MVPASLTIGLTVALCLMPGFARARPMLPGRYLADPYGALTLTLEGDRIGLGASQLALGWLDGVIINIQHSRRRHARYSDTFFNLAYAYGRKGDKDRAMHHLQATVKLGYPLHEAVVRDPKLMRELGGEQGFQSLVQKAHDQQKQSQPRDRREPEP